MTDPTPNFPDFRALCAELLGAVNTLYKQSVTTPYSLTIEIDGVLHSIPIGRDILAQDAIYAHLINSAQAALATPPPKPPTDEEIAAAIQKGADQEFHATVEALAKYCDAGVELTHSDAREVLYELRRPHIVLDHWGNEKQ